MNASYIQYAAGYNKEAVSTKDIKKAIQDIQEMDEEHGAFWVSVITEDENVMEVNKDLSLSIIFMEKETKYQASSWEEVSELYHLLLNKEFEKIKQRIQN